MENNTDQRHFLKVQFAPSQQRAVVALRKVESTNQTSCPQRHSTAQLSLPLLRAHGFVTGSWKFILSWMAGFFDAAVAAAAPCAGAPAAPAACSAAFSRRATCSRSLLAAGRAVTTALNAAAAADVGMADTSLQAMLRRTGVAGMLPGGFATSINNGTKTLSTAACNSNSTPGLVSHACNTHQLMMVVTNPHSCKEPPYTSPKTG